MISNNQKDSRNTNEHEKTMLTSTGISKRKTNERQRTREENNNEEPRKIVNLSLQIGPLDYFGPT